MNRNHRVAGVQQKAAVGLTYQHVTFQTLLDWSKEAYLCGPIWVVPHAWPQFVHSWDVSLREISCVCGDRLCAPPLSHIQRLAVGGLRK